MKKDWGFKIFVVFFVILSLLLTIAAKNLTFLANDTYETIVVAKAFAGFYNIPVFHLHTVVYMLLGSLTFLFTQSLIPFKILTTLILLFSGYLIYKITNDKKAFLLWAFSPVPWMSFGSIEPMVPSSILVLVAYLFYKNYERTNRKGMLFASGLALGLASALYEGAWPIVPIFLLIYFWGRKFNEVILFLVAFVFGFSTKLLLDYMLFGSAFATTARMLGGNIILFIGLGKTTNIKYINWLKILYQLVLISPIQILIYKLYNKDKKDFIFITLSSLAMVFLFVPTIRYIYMVAPLYLYLLSKIITKKSLVIHICLSIPIILFFVFLALTPHADERTILQDFKEIKQDFLSEYYVVDRAHELVLAAHSWDSTQFFWLEDYTLPEKDTPINEYALEEPSKDYLWKRLYIKAGFLSNRRQEYEESYPILMDKTHTLEFKNYSLKKCYRRFCVYTTA